MAVEVEGVVARREVVEGDFDDLVLFDDERVGLTVDGGVRGVGAGGEGRKEGGGVLVDVADVVEVGAITVSGETGWVLRVCSPRGAIVVEAQAEVQLDLPIRLGEELHAVEGLHQLAPAQSTTRASIPSE